MLIPGSRWQACECAINNARIAQKSWLGGWKDRDFPVLQYNHTKSRLTNLLEATAQSENTNVGPVIYFLC